jgi:hypothetical protein
VTVAELIEKLSEIEGHRIVVMSADGEGNNYSPLAEVYEVEYVPESTYSGYIYDDEDDEACDDEDECEDYRSSLDIFDAVVLYPIN